MVGDIVKVDWGTANEETRRVVAIANPTNPPSPAPNITLDAPLSLPHAVGTWIAGGNVQSGVNFQPAYATRGQVRGARVLGRQLRPPRVRLRLRKDERPRGSR